MRRRREKREGESGGPEQVDKATPAPATPEMSPEDTGPAVTEPPTDEVPPSPDHYIGPKGTTIGSVVTGTPPSADLAGQVITRLAESESGWALVECLNGARCWVDPADLEPIGTQPSKVSPKRQIEHPGEAPIVKEPAAKPTEVLFWFYVDAAIPVQLSDGSVVGDIGPGAWHPAHEELGGWVRTTDAHGRSGWVKAASIHRG
jgi:hypothetical protein